MIAPVLWKSTERRNWVSNQTCYSQTQSGSEAGSGDEDDDEVGDDDVIEGDDDVSSDAVRGAGDGQEEAKVDDDEDRRNPQYIPKASQFRISGVPQFHFKAILSQAGAKPFNLPKRFYFLRGLWYFASP